MHIRKLWYNTDIQIETGCHIINRKIAITAAISGLALTAAALLYRHAFSSPTASSIGIIGGADGPTAILVAGNPSGWICSIASFIGGITAIVSVIALILGLLKKKDS